MIRHLYFHIPFCPKLCPYCCFYVEVGSRNKNRAFLDALLTEVEHASREHHIRPETIYFGGGTPTALLADQLDYLLTGLRQRLDLSDLVDWTIEANPSTVRPEKARILRSLGITRVSLGVQSWDDDLLRTLGRVHTAAQAEKTYHILRDAAFPSVNVDLMFSVPGQTREQWAATLERTIHLAPDHVSSYCLTYEEDTEYFRKLTAGTYRQDDDRDADLFERTMSTLHSAGLHQYEISNYARPGHKSRHNRAYWLGADYLGFGPSAYSTVGGSRWENVRDTAAYTRSVLVGEKPHSSHEHLSPERRAGEIAAFRIRMSEGIPLAELGQWREQIEEFHRIGLLTLTDDCARLTLRGKMLADSVAEIFIV